MGVHSPEDLQRIYDARFRNNLEYRKRIWAVLVTDWFARYVKASDAVLELGCGWGEFINQIRAAEVRHGSEPREPRAARPGIEFLHQDCSERWPLDDTLDTVFTSNFFEHLPDKTSLGRTLREACRCLKPGGRLVVSAPTSARCPAPTGTSGITISR